MAGNYLGTTSKTVTVWNNCNCYFCSDEIEFVELDFRCEGCSQQVCLGCYLDNFSIEPENYKFKCPGCGEISTAVPNCVD